MAVPSILGIHHITMISADAQRTVDFYTDVLGVRLVKKTVNFDDTGAYHLYFGDDSGSPGTLLTFFEWKDARRGHWGIGTTHHLALVTASADTQLQWKRWLTDHGVPVTGPYDRTYFRSIYFTDPDGLILEIATYGPGWTVDEPAESLGMSVVGPPAGSVREARDEASIDATTWPEPVPAISPAMKLQGLHHITAIASDIGRTSAFYTDVLAMRIVKRTFNYDDPSSPHYYFAAGNGAPGGIITYFGYPPHRMREGMVGTGMTHHFALAVSDDEAQRAWHAHLEEAGVAVTPVMDRKYFRSIYFSDPDGHVMELATLGPGFLVDEGRDALGSQLSLPPWLEPRRAEIESSLTPLHSA